MKAVIKRRYGPPEVLEIAELPKPAPADNEILVQVRAVSINPLDWHGLTGTPYIARVAMGFGTPKDMRFGVDFSGVIETIGKDVSGLEPGDNVFGTQSGAMAEYVTVAADTFVRKPANVTFEQAAAIPVAALTALQGLRDKGGLGNGQHVLINGASGGVGTFAVQIAKALGAVVTGVCSTTNVELVSSLGADQVIDYTKENFTGARGRYDVVLDNVGNHSLRDTRRVLKSDGRLVIVSGPKRNPWFGPLPRVMHAALLSPFVRQRMVFFISSARRPDLEILAELVEAGTVTPVIDRRYPLDQVAAAVAYLGKGHARAKVIVGVQ